MSYKTQVEDLIGSVGDDALITQALIDTGTKIIQLMPSAKLRKYSDEGLPICIAEPESDLSKLYLNIAEKIHRFDH